MFWRFRKYKRSQSECAMYEFPYPPKSLVVCSRCGSAHYKKRWVHLSDLSLPKNTDGMPVQFHKCPACTMIAHHQYEGRVIIKGVPGAYAHNLEHFIQNYFRKTQERDPLLRLISFIQTPEQWEITVTKNKLANNVSRKIRNRFNGASVSTRLAEGSGDIEEVFIWFQ